MGQAGSTCSTPPAPPTMHFLHSLVETGEGGTPKAGERGWRVLGLGLGLRRGSGSSVESASPCYTEFRELLTGWFWDKAVSAWLLCCEGKKILPTNLLDPVMTPGWKPEV